MSVNNNKKIEIIIAIRIPNSPEAIGLLLFSGCCRSGFICIESLIIYILPVIMQKSKKEIRTCLSSDRLEKCNEKIIGAKINRFFTHCFGLIEIVINFNVPILHVF